VRIIGEQSDTQTSVLPTSSGQGRVREAPTLSIVVLPFQNLNGKPEHDYLSDAITDDLTSDLSRIPDSFVIARASAYAWRHSTEDVRQISGQLGVRYVVQGSVRRLGRILRVNVQLVSGETGANLWADRFDTSIGNVAACQEMIVCRIGSALAIELVDAEARRSLLARPVNPSASDLIIRARSLLNQPFDVRRNQAARVLYEQALASDPTSLRAILGLVRVLVMQFQDRDYWAEGDMEERVVNLLARAQSIAPHDEEVLGSSVRLIEIQRNWQQLMVAAQDLIDRYPKSVYGYLYLARGKIATGGAADAISLLARTIELNPRDQYLWDRYWRMGFALQLAERDEEAITWHRRALSAYPDAPSFFRSQRLRAMASAWALSGQTEAARRAIAEADGIWPFATVRSLSLLNPSSKALVAQMRRFQNGLRLAGLRDHADEDGDFGIAPDNVLRADLVGLTPKLAPGAGTIVTMELSAMLGRHFPLIIDTAFGSWGRSIPGAIGLKSAGIGGSLDDVAQNRLRAKMHVITKGGLSRPIVAVGRNSEHFDGYNLALRLVGLGYTNVHWYRGGREAWEVNGLPDSEIDMQEW
jgi:adenylate cyclase